MHNMTYSPYSFALTTLSAVGPERRWLAGSGRFWGPNAVGALSIQRSGGGVELNHTAGQTAAVRAADRMLSCTGHKEHARDERVRSITANVSTLGMVEIRQVYVEIRHPFPPIKPEAGGVWATQNYTEVDNATDGWLCRVII